MVKLTHGEKLYYSISEVAKITGLKEYVLRFWEKEFDQLNPKKNRGGNRIYTQKDIEVVNRINHLRKKEKLTIEGARAKLTMKKQKEEKTVINETAKSKTLIGQIRKDINDILKDFT